ncbi:MULTISPECIES: TonB-dependent receptor domain-containing protein [Stenotrophomonas]|uniref:TonB-dependent receptor domain-containing protein n=1 Tax=Stenotrophomonas TaxID=40323 RepID=UPI0002EA9D62|nr:TonB-dependent receptor [Stenotrophomonas sp. SKA14]MBH1553267.1 TonB-dependent receptor [Stenotrophomonas maltophilia]MBH1600423.1 TonB-dependent receptor [Stenotrophomonas maltophilia]
MKYVSNTARRNTLAVALISALMAAAPAMAQDKATNLDKITVTGSLIPQTQVETQTPVMSITSEDIQARGFTSVAEVLQQSSLTTGGLQGGQTSGAFTQGAEASGMFGLNPGYTKYLINGRPMLSYPALYNGSESFNNLSGIPVDIVERIEVLPGGQSSLYGSDAIAGVVNIILKEHMDGGTMTVRGGTYTEGGGSNLRISGAHGFTAVDGRFNALVNVQYEKGNPIWGYQRDITRQNNPAGFSPQAPSNDFLVTGGGKYYMMDPSRCANVAGLYDGTTTVGFREGKGESCGSIYSAGYKTLKNAKDSGQFYSTMTFDVNDNLQLFADVLYSKEKTEFTSGSSALWWGTQSGMGGFYDQSLGKVVNLQRAFAPEEIGVGDYNNILNADRSRSYQVTLGAKGMFGDWDYSASFTRGEYRLDQDRFVRWKDKINGFFADRVLGQQLGTYTDPTTGGKFGIYNPNYAAFYSPITPEEFGSFTGYGTHHSKTWQNLGRVQLTNGSLFSLPGGDAGLAVVLEGGSEGWNYTPNQSFIDGNVWGTTAVAGAGHRSNYAVTSELRMPLHDMVTVSASGRYDAFKIADNTVDKATYSIGIEFRPLESLLFRGKYGTAFRAPTLSDAFQGMSGSYASSQNDYYRCNQAGFALNDDRCPYYKNTSVYSEKSGNPDLKPITADVWSAGVVWAPVSNFSLSVDYYNWKIKNEVKTLSSDQLLLAEYACATGSANNTSASCQDVANWITRDNAGAITRVYTPKLNVASQNLEAVAVSAKYQQDIGRFGSLNFSGNYTNMLKRELQPLPGAKKIDLLSDPYNMYYYDNYAKVRGDLSVAWNIDKFTTTVYANYVGSTPNYVAYLGRSYDYTNRYGAKAGKWGSYTTYNMSFAYRAQEDLTLSLMVNNVFNKMPTGQRYSYEGTDGAPYNSAFYSIYGRSIQAQMKYDFGK